MSSPKPEPWLRGKNEELPAVHLAVLNALQLTLENVEHWCSTLSSEEFHSKPHGLPSIGFHLRHIARSSDRLLTYAEGNQLSELQLAALKTESDPGVSSDSILEEFRSALGAAFVRIRNMRTIDLELSRLVGRLQLPTTVGGLLVHIADHTQRHTGQIVTTAKILLAMRGG